MSQLETFRQRKDAMFRTSADSPIPASQRASFTKLNYFPENPDLRFTLDLDEFTEKEPITMLTSTGSTQNYLRWGQIHFPIDDEVATLTVYYASWGGYFLPFVDATCGNESYGAGRYLELHELGDGKFIVDFNLAYNPYCAYSDAYSCPIPPAENRISLPIRAGEQNYDH
jgi:uncharacterized protein (DUF1684 family)